MKKHLLSLVILICVSLSAFSQHFEWAASMGKAQTETLASVMDSEGNITQVVSWQTSYYTKYKEAHFIFDAYGDTIRLKHKRTYQLVVVQFDKNGKHTWHKVILSRGRSNPEDVLLTVDNSNNISVFINSPDICLIDDETFEQRLNTDKFIKNKNSFLDREKEDEDEETDIEENYLKVKDYKKEWRGLVEFKLNKKGSLIDIKRILPSYLIETHSAISTTDNGVVFLASIGDDKITIGNLKIDGKKGGGYILLKIDKEGNAQWVKTFNFMDESCCSYVMPYPSIAQSPNGNIYVAGAMGGGIEFPNGKKVDFKTDPDPKKQRNQFQGFVAAFNKSGKMLWQKTSGGRNTIHSLYANNKTVYISGKSRVNAKIFGKKADTTRGKNGFVLAIDAKKGKSKWLQSNSTNGFVTLTQDTEGNIYGLGEYSAHKHAKLNIKEPCVFETDTLKNYYQRTIIASYDKKGKYRWVKSSTGLLYTWQHHYNLLINDCNNLFLTGSVFAGMKIPSQYIDGAFMKGEAYGSMAYLSKIKNNTNQLDTNALVKQDSIKSNPLFQYREVAGKAIEGQTGCGVSPGPWEMIVYPNPFNGQATVKIKTTFDDNNVNLLIMDMKGQTISSIFNDMKLEQGVYTYLINAPTLNMSKGQYLIVLRGSATILSERIIYK